MAATTGPPRQSPHGISGNGPSSSPRRDIVTQGIHDLVALEIRRTAGERRSLAIGRRPRLLDDDGLCSQVDDGEIGSRDGYGLPYPVAHGIEPIISRLNSSHAYRRQGLCTVAPM
jgi:hypothetical protein